VSYANIANMIWTLTGEKGLLDFIRRLTFTIVTGNGDMHLKNWSLIYKDGITPTLSPAYDLVSTIPYIPNDGLALNLANTKKMSTITVGHFKRLIKKAHIPEKIVLRTVQDTVGATLIKWKENNKNYALSSDISQRIQRHMDSLLLTKSQ